MRKVVLAISMFVLSFEVSAQVKNGTPQPPSSPSSPPPTTVGYNGNVVPIPPATYLLIGLGVASVSTFIFRNTKNNKEE
ncbi:MAG: hypothetical protein U0L37_04445 [Bacteroidales bacterium]|nr:hypothetical protein [Bacteroidales bacterium]